MSERKVLQKYYPPDFDPSKILRTRAAPSTGPKTQTVRLMAPFSMKCIACGEYIYKGRKFNARKETTEEKYLGITIYRFYIRCTRCSGEITFKTDPKGMDYVCERGAKRNFEVWRKEDPDANKMETEDEMLERLEAEEAERGGAMAELETKVGEAKREMEIADALDEIRVRNARVLRAEGRGGDVDVDGGEEAKLEREREREKKRLEAEDEERAKEAFAARRGNGEGETEDVGTIEGSGGSGGGVKGKTVGDMPPPTFKRAVKKKKDLAGALGIKRKPALV